MKLECHRFIVIKDLGAEEVESCFLWRIAHRDHQVPTQQKSVGASLLCSMNTPSKTGASVQMWDRPARLFLRNLNINRWQMSPNSLQQSNCGVGEVLKEQLLLHKLDLEPSGERALRRSSSPWSGRTPGLSPSSSASSPTWWSARPSSRLWSPNRRGVTAGSWRRGSTNFCAGTTWPEPTSRSWSSWFCSSSRTKPESSGSSPDPSTSPSLWSRP